MGVADRINTKAINIGLVSSAIRFLGQAKPVFFAIFQIVYLLLQHVNVPESPHQDKADKQNSTQYYNNLQVDIPTSFMKSLTD